MDQTSTDAAASATPDTSTDKPAERTYTKDELTKIVQREVGKVAEKLSLTESQLATLAEEKRAAEEAKLSASDRVAKEREREKAAYEKKLADLEARATAERSKRHDALRKQHAASFVAKHAQSLLSPDMAPILEGVVLSRLLVETDAEGNEILSATMGAAGDSEPFTTAESKLVESLLAPFLKGQGGSGASHGKGSGKAAALAITDPQERILAGLTRR